MKILILIFIAYSVGFCPCYSFGSSKTVEEFKIPAIGSKIELELKDGRIINGKLQNITENKVYIDMDGACIGFKQKQISQKSRRLFFKEDYDNKKEDTESHVNLSVEKKLSQEQIENLKKQFSLYKTEFKSFSKNGNNYYGYLEYTRPAQYGRCSECGGSGYIAGESTPGKFRKSTPCSKTMLIKESYIENVLLKENPQGAKYVLSYIPKAQKQGLYYEEANLYYMALDLDHSLKIEDYKEEIGRCFYNLAKQRIIDGKITDALNYIDLLDDLDKQYRLQDRNMASNIVNLRNDICSYYYNQAIKFYGRRNYIAALDILKKIPYSSLSDNKLLADISNFRDKLAPLAELQSAKDAARQAASEASAARQEAEQAKQQAEQAKQEAIEQGEKTRQENENANNEKNRLIGEQNRLIEERNNIEKDKNYILDRMKDKIGN